MSILRKNNLHTVCEEANCPNRAECFSRQTATFLILGRICSRHCLYCNVEYGHPQGVDFEEVERVLEAIRVLALDYAVITSVTRDDLPDGGAGIFARLVRRLREEMPHLGIEVLIPDFGGNEAAIEEVIEARPDVINHNIECVSSLFPLLRPQGSYKRSLDLLKQVSERGDIRTKTGLMVGLGETEEEIEETFRDLLGVNCRWITIGQYQRPSRSHWPVFRYYEPEEFVRFEEKARAMGFEEVVSGPLVRSSYRAGYYVRKNTVKDWGG